jgi:predicted peptidase
MMKKRYFILMMLLPCCLVAKAQSTTGFEKSVYIIGNDTLPYRLLYPQNYDKHKHYPLVLFLHGASQRGNDNESQLTGVPKTLTDSAGRAKYACFIMVPQCAKKDVWVNFPTFPKSLEPTAQATPSARLALRVLDSLIKHLSVDKRRIYITGYSMGGEGSFDLLTRQPKLFAAAIPICSVADTSKAKLIYKTPIWAFHGDMDDVNDVKYTRMMINKLKEQGGKPIYTEYPGIKHNSWTKAYSEPGLFDWLFLQSR